MCGILKAASSPDARIRLSHLGGCAARTPHEMLVFDTNVASLITLRLQFAQEPTSDQIRF